MHEVIPLNSVTVTDFKARCHQILDQISQTGESVTVTKHGKPIAVVSPVASEPGLPYRLGLFVGKAKILADLIEPVQ